MVQLNEKEMQPSSRGKVREIYDLEDGNLVIVTTDRISAFDVIIPALIKNKGKILNKLSLFWFDYTNSIIKNHIISDDVTMMPKFFQNDYFKDRTVLVKKLKILPYEFVMRGYIFGHLWEAYNSGEKLSGLNLKPGYKVAGKLEIPVLTPALKKQNGHDEYTDMHHVSHDLGRTIVTQIEEICFELYKKCYDFAYTKGIIIADSKFEFGIDEDGNLLLADEIFTPDSSRLWNLSEYKTGVSPKSYDKQLIRDWLLGNKINGEMQFDNIPLDILDKTSMIYQDCMDKIIMEKE
jgi:phosphoribosylaminoimidazole-succinocarboxamide synthase